MRYGTNGSNMSGNVFVADRYGVLISKLSLLGYFWVSGCTFQDGYGNTVTVLPVK